MEWLVQLFTNGESVAHIVLLYAIVITAGVLLGKLKIGGISLGVTFVLFVGIFVGHFLHVGQTQYNFTPEPLNVLNFIQDFGLILFVYSIGLQVGPSFFTSLKGNGVRMNMAAFSIILLNVVVMLILYYTCMDKSKPDSFPMMVGVLCGAVTNTPGLGAANAALDQIGPETFGGQIPVIANGYACAYPLGVVGIIGAIILIKVVFRISLKKEEEDYYNKDGNNTAVKPHLMHLKVVNPSMQGKTILQVRYYLGRDFVCTRCLQNGHVVLPNKDTELHVGDLLYIVCAEEDAEAITAFIGEPVKVEWEKQDVPMASKKVLVTKSSINGKTLASLHPSSMYGVNVSRIYRSGMELFASPHVTLQVGDRLTVVGPEDAVDRFSHKLGNMANRLDKPNLVTIFFGILCGIIFGSIPFNVGLSMPVKLGLAGGPLIIAILVGRFGFKMKLVAYTTTSASMMIRDIGLVLFLASVGIKAGGNAFVIYGFIITIVPLILVGGFMRLKYKQNYFYIMGLIAGATTDPPALAYSTATANNDVPSVAYSTVYPLSMFLRIITAQMLILVFYT